VYSIYYNPAGLVNLKGGQFSAAIQMCVPDVKFNDYTVTGGESSITGAALPDLGGTEIKDDSDGLFIPFMGYAQPITKNLAFGVAAYVPFGLDVKWKDSTVGAQNWYHSYYVRETFTPTLSYKINDKLSVGAGIALGKSKSGAEKILNLAAPSEANALFTGLDTYSAANADAAYTNVYNYTHANVYNRTYTSYPGFTTDPVGVAAAAAAAATAAADAAAPVAAAQGRAGYTALAQAYAAYEGRKLELELEDSFNYSINAGIQYTPSDKVALGLTYRGRAEADFSGDVTITGYGKVARSEERRVGKECRRLCRSRWSPYH
jgi:long-chain fatty acid transport protein